jgi:outer membrane protein assembly factor BamA
MHRLFALLLAGTALCAQAQKFIPKSIQFHGDPEYTDQELMTAAGLKKGVVLDYAGMNECSKQLLATGVFATLAFKFDGQDLVFTLTPSTDLIPARFQNLPLAPDFDLDVFLRKQVPLYHGQVPAENGLMESVRSALEKLMADRGIAATVVGTAAADLATHKVNSVVFSITSPPVTIGKTQLNGVSDAMLPGVQHALDEITRQPFDTANSSGNLRQSVERFYQDQGYAGVKVRVMSAGAPVISPDAIQVPFSISVDQGRVYRLASIQLPPDSPLAQNDMDKLLADRPGAPPLGVRIRAVWEALSRQYKSKGYLDCTITPTPHLNDDAATVSYTVDINPGPVYHLAYLKFDNVSDQMRTLLLHYWQMMPGDVFNENYVSQFIVSAQQQDPVLKRSLAGVKVGFDATEDQLTHTVNLVIRLSR